MTHRRTYLLGRNFRQSKKTISLGTKNKVRDIYIPLPAPPSKSYVFTQSDIVQKQKDVEEDIKRAQALIAYELNL